MVYIDVRRLKCIKSKQFHRGEIEVIRLFYLVLLLSLSLLTGAVKVSLNTEVHDVAVTYVEVGRPMIGFWGTTHIEVAVQNLGNVSETFQVAAYVTRNSDNAAFGPDAYTIDLAPGQIDYLPFIWGPNINPVIMVFPPLIYSFFPPPWPWPPDEPLAENFTAWAEADVPNDSDFSNNICVNGNTTVVWWVIDVCPEGLIDVKDVAAIAKAFGSYPEHSAWNPCVDFNSDEKIDIRDIAACAKHFGALYP